MPLVYQEAENHQRAIASDTKLRELEISGFVKCVARKTCLDNVPRDERIKVLRESLAKQFKDWQDVEGYGDLKEKEALADLRNVAGLLFVAFK